MVKYTNKVRRAQLGTSVGCNDLSATYSVDAANNAAVNNTSGHGKMAELALTLADKFRGRHAENVGVANEKDGADRLVDGTMLQTKFYSSGKGCVDACFADKSSGGMYRYINSDGTPMPVEVPKDMYGDAVSRFAQKISDGKVPGVTEPADADKYVKQSILTYDNAKNLCLPLTKESLIYDAATGIVHCFFAFVISTAAAFIFALQRKKPKGKAVLNAFKSGAKVFGLTYPCHILMSQLARTEFFISLRSLIGLESAAESGGRLLSLPAEVNNGLKIAVGGTAVSVKAAAKQFSKILCAGFIMNSVALIFFVLPDFVGMLRGKMSAREFGLRALDLLIARLFSTLALTSAAVITPMFSIPPVLNIPICLAAACLGGVHGRRLIHRRRKRMI